jgi:hypothetical protein
MKKTIAALAFLACAASQAEPTVLKMESLGWEARFDAPATVGRVQENSVRAYRYVGNAGRFNLSLFVEDPSCRGGVALEDQVRCFIDGIVFVPEVVKESIRVNRIARGTQLSYLVYAPVDGKQVKMLHTHLLFAGKGKWGDLHASVIQPSVDEIAMLMGLGDTSDFSN